MARCPLETGSTYPPRRCGLAAFSQDLRAGLLGVAPDWRVDVVAVDRDGLEYGDEMLAVIEQDSAQSYLDAAAVIAVAGTDVVVIEHEYGIMIRCSPRSGCSDRARDSNSRSPPCR